MNEDQPGTSERERVSTDTVSSALYARMRRYRDYQLTACKWYIVILIAILGGILSIKFGWSESHLSKLLSESLLNRSVVALLPTLTGANFISATVYLKQRNDRLRDLLDKHFEPQWNTFEPQNSNAQLWYLMVSAMILLTMATDIVIFFL